MDTQAYWWITLDFIIETIEIMLHFCKILSSLNNGVPSTSKPWYCWLGENYDFWVFRHHKVLARHIMNTCISFTFPSLVITEIVFSP